MEKIPENYFSIHLKFLRSVGVNLIPIKNPYIRFIYNMYSILVFITIYIGYSILQSVKVYQERNDIEKVIFILSHLITHVIGCLKGILFVMKKKILIKHLLSFESEEFKANVERGGRKEIQLIKRAIALSTIQAGLFYLMVTAVVINRIIFVIRDPSVTEIVFNPETNTTIHLIHRTLPWMCWFWFDTNSTPNYQIAFAYQSLCILVFGIMVGFLDTLISAMLVHLNAQFTILRNAIETVAERARKMQKNELGLESPIENWELIPKNNPILSKQLNSLIRNYIIHHNKIIDLSKNVEDEFNIMVLFQVLGSMLLICLLMYQLSFIPLFSTEFLNMCSYLLLMLYQLGIYCYNGNEITRQSQAISIAAYNSDWISADDVVKKCLVLLMVRAQRPIQMSAGKFVILSLETFMNLLRGSVSYFMVLRQMNNK